MDRRYFLLLTSGFLAYPLYRWRSSAYSQSPNHGMELVSGYGQWVESAIDRVDPSLPSRVVFFNPSSGHMAHYPAPFRVHMAVQNPNRAEYLILISKWGNEICSFNRLKGSVEKLVRSESTRRFFGHAVWDNDEDGFWVVEQDDAAFQGRIVLRGEDLAIRREISSHGIYPHDLQFAAPGILSVANNGDYFGLSPSDAKSLPPEFQFSNLTWIRTEDGVVQRQVRFPDLLGKAGASHFQFLPNRNLVFVGGKTRQDNDPSVVIRIGEDGSTRILKVSEDAKDFYQGEAVSFAFDGHQVVWTHSKEKGIFSALPDGHEAKLLSATRTRGIAHVGSEIFLSHAKKQVLLRTKEGHSFQEIQGPNLEGHRWGSHLTRITDVFV